MSELKRRVAKPEEASVTGECLCQSPLLLLKGDEMPEETVCPVHRRPRRIIRWPLPRSRLDAPALPNRVERST